MIHHLGIAASIIYSSCMDVQKSSWDWTGLGSSQKNLYLQMCLKRTSWCLCGWYNAFNMLPQNCPVHMRGMTDALIGGVLLPSPELRVHKSSNISLFSPHYHRRTAITTWANTRLCCSRRPCSDIHRRERHPCRPVCFELWDGCKTSHEKADWGGTLCAAEGQV